MTTAGREFVAWACLITYVAAVGTSLLLNHQVPATQNIEQQVIVMPEATPAQLDQDLQQRIERAQNAVSHTSGR